MTSPVPSADLRIARLLEHRAWLRSVARALVHDDAAADDLEQEVWLDALRSPPDTPASPRGWLARVLRRNAADAGRSGRRRARREERAARRETTADPAALVAEAETLRRVADAVLALDEPYRGSVLLRWFEGLPPREIAARQGVPVETVRTRLKRALAQLRERLDREEHGDRRRWQAALLPFAGGATRASARRRWWVPAACAAALVAAATGAALVAGPTLWSDAGSSASAIDRESADTSDALAAGASVADDAEAEATRRGRLRAGMRTAGGDATDEPPADTWVVVHVLDDSGRSVEDATLRIEVADPEGPIDAKDAGTLRELRAPHRIDARTNPFLVRALPAGLDGFELRLSVEAPGLAPPDAKALVLESGRAQVTRVVLAQPRTAEVHVIDATTRKGVAGAVVISTSECARRRFGLADVTTAAGDGWGTADADGSARVGGLGRGKHVFLVDAEGYAPREIAAPVSDAVTAELYPVSQPTRLRVRVGTANRGPGAGAGIRLDGDGRAPPVFRRTDARGEVLFTDLPAGRHVVTLVDRAEVRRDAADRRRVFAWVAVTRTSSDAEAVARLGYWNGPGRIQVRVRDTDGRPAAGVWVAGAWAGTRTGDDGIASFLGLEAGEEWDLHVQGRTSRRLAARADDVVVEWPTAGLRVDGVVRRSDGAAFAGFAFVSLLPDATSDTATSAQVRPDGSFTLEAVRPGRVRILVSAYAGMAEARLDVPESGSPGSVELVLRKPGGLVVLVPWKPEGELSVRRGEDPPISLPRFPSAGGSNRLAHNYLFPGLYTLEGKLGDADVRREIEIREGEETLIDMR